MTTQYYWKRSSGERESTAQAVGERLALIAARHGSIEPQYVVTDAAERGSPLQEYFEWDDTEAARKHRLHQARQLINRVGVRIIDQPAAPLVQAFVNVLPASAEGDQRYEPVLAVMSDAEKRRRFLRQAMTELRAWQKRYADLSELGEIFAAIDKRVAEVEAVPELAH